LAQVLGKLSVVKLCSKLVKKTEVPIRGIQNIENRQETEHVQSNTYHAPVIIKLRKWFIITHVFRLALFVHIILPVESITVQETTTCRANNGCMLNQNITQHPIHRQKEKRSKTRTKKRR